MRSKPTSIAVLPWQAQAWLLLRRYVGPQGAGMAALGLLVFAGTGLVLLGPRILQQAIDAAAAGTTAAALGRLGLLYVAVMAATRAVQGAAACAAAGLAWKATNRLRVDLVRRVLALPLQFHGGFTPGQLAERIDGDAGALHDFFSQFVLQLLANAVLLSGVIVVLFLEDWRVGLTFLFSLLATLLVYGRLADVAVPAAAAVRQAQAEQMGVLEENLRGAEDARPLGAGPYLLERFLRAARKHVTACGRSWPRNAVPLAVTLVILGLNEAVSLALGVTLVERGVFTVGTVYLLVQYNDLVGRPLRDMAKQLGGLQATGACVGRVGGLLSAGPEGTGRRDRRRPLPDGPLGVRFENVSLAYPGGPPVLQGIDLALAPGRSLAVVGRTGSGKSSMARLLLGLYEPTGGSIALVQGAETYNLQDVALEDLRRRVGLVTQEVQLFAASLRDNLTLFGAIGGADDARLTHVLEELGLEEWLGGLPKGLDTPLLGAQGGLSAGQAQLVSLARVFLRDPGLVLLDEASSRLDPASEALLTRAVERLLSGRTAIVIAHRLATLRRMDGVIVIEDGRVVESGTREALARDPASRFHGVLEGLS